MSRPWWERDAEACWHPYTQHGVGERLLPVTGASGAWLELADGSREQVRIPAEIWRRNAERVSKLFMTASPVVAVHLDPQLETADADTSNNHYPPQLEQTRFEVYKDKDERSNPMREAAEREAKPEPEQAEAKP